MTGAKPSGPWTTGADLASELAGFAAELRFAGVAVDPARIAVAAAALTEFPATGPDAIYWGTRLTLCSRKADLPLFDAAFAARFGRPAAAPDSGVPDPGAPAAPVVASAITVAETAGGFAGGPADEPGGAASGVDPQRVPGVGAAGVAGVERLGSRDLRTLTETERAEVLALIALLGATHRSRRSMRRVPGGRNRIDVGRTAAAMVRGGGEPVRLHRRRRTEQPRRLLLLLDVSGSMRLYRDALLRFAHAAVRADPAATEVFTLGTRCTRITSALRARNPDLALRTAARLGADWGGGTRLGPTLREFLRGWGGTGTVRSAIVVIASDGCEFGAPALLARQVARLSRLAHLLVWVNPQQGWPGFEPSAPGLVDSLPYVDRPLPGHSLDALRKLAEVISR
ncbi:VWA domain-containing protein [Plantactinospora sp. S1510]|uniref:VWA domain-containing protein n=1 Tax=Plantactinospora alkalitolerans TaxID=2789879 RepID=A0ABS0H5D4_9ACTN|nr:VWA domain-containing protein [Plantactinospora alkalitolerans]MBF9133676.1 VWA domain-containing protein [Plantactinospora alkalitolerans]